MRSPLEVRFSDRLKKRFPSIYHKRVLVAVSGGLDSVTLAHLLKAERIDIALAHVNFQLRGTDSQADARFVAELAAALDVPFHLKEAALQAYRSTHKGSVQMAARALRYEWFAHLLEQHGYHWIATAHQAEDSLETFVLNLARGTGIEGLSGMADRRDKLIRPLLAFSKASLEAYALARGIAWREDSSNRTDSYTRNKIRHHILPAFERLHPEAKQNFLRSIEQLQHIQTIALQGIGRNLEVVSLREGEQLTIDLSALRELTPLETHLHYLLKPYGFSDLSACQKSVFAPRSGKVFRSKTHRLLVDRDRWIIVPLQGAAPQRYLLTALADFEQAGLPLQARISRAIEDAQGTACVDAHKLRFPLNLRKWRAGDRFHPLGMKGSKKLSDYFQERKFSRLDKEATWILENGDGAIIWVVGHRLDERFKVETDSRTILCLTPR